MRLVWRRQLDVQRRAAPVHQIMGYATCDKMKHSNHHGGRPRKTCGFYSKLDIYRVVVFDLSSEGNRMFVCSLEFNWRNTIKKERIFVFIICSVLFYFGFFCFIFLLLDKTDGGDLLDRSSPTTLESGLLEKKWHLNLFWFAWRVLEGVTAFNHSRKAEMNVYI